jgi:hypothetical protein
VPIVGVFDLVEADGVMEAKTGQTKWDQGRCDASLQGQLYAWAYTRDAGAQAAAGALAVLSHGPRRAAGVRELPALGEMALIEVQAAAGLAGHPR